MKKLLPFLAMVVLFGCDKEEVLTLEQHLMASTWSVIDYEITYDGITEKMVVGIPDTDIYPAFMPCNDGTYKEVDIEYTYSLEYSHITFNSDKTFSSKSKTSYTSYDYLTSTCENIVYMDEIIEYNSETDDLTSSDTWNFTENTKTLTITSVYELSDGTSETSNEEYSIELANGILTLTTQDPADGSNMIINTRAL